MAGILAFPVTTFHDPASVTTLGCRSKSFGFMGKQIARGRDPDTKLVPAYLVGKRRRPDAVAFMADLSERLTNRVQISSDSN